MNSNVYLLKVASLNNTTQRFEFYRDEVFSSKAKLERAVENMIDCNNGYNISREEMDFSSYKEKHITYSCVSTDGRGMRVRYVLRKMKLQ